MASHTIELAMVAAVMVAAVAVEALIICADGSLHALDDATALLQHQLQHQHHPQDAMISFNLEAEVDGWRASKTKRMHHRHTNLTTFLHAPHGGWQGSLSPASAAQSPTIPHTMRRPSILQCNACSHDPQG